MLAGRSNNDHWGQVLQTTGWLSHVTIPQCNPYPGPYLRSPFNITPSVPPPRPSSSVGYTSRRVRYSRFCTYQLNWSAAGTESQWIQSDENPCETLGRATLSSAGGGLAAARKLTPGNDTKKASMCWSDAKTLNETLVGGRGVWPAAQNRPPLTFGPGPGWAGLGWAGLGKAAHH